MSNTKIVYLCDGSRCSVCNMDMCMLTTDIEHAKNFQKLEDTGVWMEKEEKEVIRCKDCKYSVDYYNDGECYCQRPGREMQWIGKKWDFFCAAGRKRGESE